MVSTPKSMAKEMTFGFDTRNNSSYDKASAYEGK